MLVSATVATRALKLAVGRLRTPRAERPRAERPDAGATADGGSGRAEAVPGARREVSPEQAQRNESKVPPAPEPDRFRIEFLSGATGQGAPLAAVEVRAESVFAAIRTVDRAGWPAGATGFRVFDSGGREVFWRQKPEYE